jgi:hypothetical protein
MQLKPKQLDKYDGKRDFQTIYNWIASVGSYFALTESKPTAIHHHLNTVFTGNATTSFPSSPVANLHHLHTPTAAVIPSRRHL